MNDRKKRIFVVDDNNANLTACKKILKPHYETFTMPSVEKMFELFSDTITPHKLRHFYCSNALESGYQLHEVANQAGHQDIRTTMQYEHPSTKTMREKANNL